MEIFKITNGGTIAQISAKGAELLSYRSGNYEHNWIWSGQDVWSRNAPLLFPVVGKLKNDQLIFNGQSYAMTQHGFARDSEFSLVSKEENRIVLSLVSSDSTRRSYPFEFRLDVIYTVSERGLWVGFKVVNTDQREIFFNFGWHPGFVAPWPNHSGSLVSVAKEFGRRSYLRKGYLEEAPITEISAKEICLAQDSFQEDALVFKNLNPSKITWSHPENRFALSMDCGSAPHLGLWTKDLSKFLCIEPWWGYADAESFNGSFDRKRGIQSLLPSQEWSGSCLVKIVQDEGS